MNRTRTITFAAIVALGAGALWVSTLTAEPRPGIHCAGTLAHLLPGWEPTVTVIASASGTLDVRYAEPGTVRRYGERDGGMAIRYDGVGCSVRPGGEFTVRIADGSTSPLQVETDRAVRIRVEEPNGFVLAEGRIDPAGLKALSLDW